MSMALQRGRLGRVPTPLLGAASHQAITAPRIASSAEQRRLLTVQQLDHGRDNRERVVILGSAYKWTIEALLEKHPRHDKGKLRSCWSRVTGVPLTAFRFLPATGFGCYNLRTELTKFVGWAGYTLARSLDPKKYQAVVVSPRSYFVFTPLLASTSTGTLEFRTALEPIRSRRTAVNFFQGWADSVDFKNKTVTIEEGVDDPNQGLALAADRHASESKEERRAEKVEEAKKGQLFDLTYDKLIISVGCYSHTFGTPGVKENALFLKDVGDARKIRNRLLACFETASLPTTSDEMRKNLLNFAIVGGGPTGIEFSAELHDIIREDLSKLYPELMKFYRITVYDVAPRVLSMFDENLGKYAMSVFKREGIEIKTSHHVEELRRGVPSHQKSSPGVKEPKSCWTLKVKEDGEIGVGMVVWSTGLMMNPFVEQALGKVQPLPQREISLQGQDVQDLENTWVVKKHPKSGAIVTNEQLRIILEPQGHGKEGKTKAIMEDVYALGDCGIIEGTSYPATAQVANQKAVWLAKRLNRRDIEGQGFTWKNMGVMAYIGNWNAIMQSGGGGNVSGRAAWLIWRGAYLTKAVSWRNKVLIPVYWFINWVFGRDVSRF